LAIFNISYSAVNIRRIISWLMHVSALLLRSSPLRLHKNKTDRSDDIFIYSKTTNCYR